MIGPGYHAFISASSLGWPVRASFLLLSLFVPVLSFAFLVFVSFCFLCVAFVFLSSSPLLVGWFLWFRVLGILGSLLPSPVLGLRLAPMCFAWFCCVISLCWGFGSFRAASARRVHVVLGICPPVSRPVGGVDGSDSESSVDEAVGDVPSDRLYLAVGEHHLISSFSGGCVASQ